MFINTHAEAKLAAKIAAEYGFSALTAEKFYKRYTDNVFSPWSSDDDARAAKDAIRRVLNVSRAAREIGAAKLDEASAQAAHDRVTRTGESAESAIRAVTRGYD